MQPIKTENIEKFNVLLDCKPVIFFPNCCLLFERNMLLAKTGRSV